LVVFAGKLNICRIVTAWRGDGVDTSAMRATANKSGQGEASPAALADSSQTTILDRLIPKTATVGLIDKFNQFSTFGKGACIATVVRTTSHYKSP
jgi:hypothetical protein